MFGLFKKEKSDVFTAPVTGQLMPLDALNDGVFSEKMMGGGVRGCARRASGLCSDCWDDQFGFPDKTCDWDYIRCGT